MIEVLRTSNLKKEDIPAVITLYKERTGVYKYSIDQIYKKTNGDTTRRNTEHHAGSLEPEAFKKYEVCIAAFIKRGYEIV